MTSAERGRRWRAKNPKTPEVRETERRRALAWKAANPERAAANSRKWHCENRERNRELAKLWCRKNPDRMREHSRRRRARKRDQLGYVTPGIEALLWRVQNGRCFHCAETLPDRPHMDHLKPIAIGGLHDDGNLALTHAFWQPDPALI